MNIKSLLLGSAAALIAAGSAKAADAIVVAEPEPVEYVRVCDAYGAGFYYIPGTETCMSINGYVWLTIGASNQNRVTFSSDFDSYITDFQSDNYPSWTSRIRLNFDTRSETEWGTLRGFIRFQADWNTFNQTLGYPVGPNGQLETAASLYIPGDGRVAIDQAFLQLGGFQAGYTESAFNVTQYGGVSNWGSHSWDGMKYGLQQRHAIMYGIRGSNGLHATLSIEDDGNANWVPDVVGVIGLNQAWGGVWAKVAYDEDIAIASGFLPLYIPPVGDDGWAASIGAQLNVPNMPGSSLRVIGFYANNANAYSVGAEWSILASYRHQFSSKLAASAAVQYFHNTDFAVAGDPDRWRGELSLVWMPVTNFEVRTELFYDKTEGSDDITSGFLRFTRYF